MNVPSALRQAHLAALARRAEGQPEAVRALLQARLQSLQASAQRARPTAPPPAEPQSPSPLAALLAELAEITGTGSIDGAEGPAGASRVDGAGSPAAAHTPSARSHRELKAVRDYRSTWSRLAVEQRLHQALASVPSNAGPLNTQRLVHQALRTLNTLSPAYLQRLVVQGEALLWLEQLSAPAPRETLGAPGPGRARKA
jgi:hypothetical protein